MSALRLCVAVIFTSSLFLIGCSGDRTLQSISVTPSSQELSAVGQTVQFRAIATYTKGTHPTTTRDVTSEVQWSSSNPAVATIDAGGLAKAIAGGETEISATMGGSLGVTAGKANVTVSYTSGAGSLTSLSIIPAAGVQKVGNVGETTQYLAIGTLSSGTTQDMTSQVQWVSSDVRVATINSAGLATAVNSGQTTITAIWTSTTTAPTTVTGGSDLTVNLTGGGGVKLPTLTVYTAGQAAAQGKWVSVVSSPAGINCIPTNQAGCTGTFPVNTTITLTATAANGVSQVGGFSSNCTLSQGGVGATVASCTTTSDTNNDTVGVIFNLNP